MSLSAAVGLHVALAVGALRLSPPESPRAAADVDALTLVDVEASVGEAVEAQAVLAGAAMAEAPAPAVPAVRAAVARRSAAPAAKVVASEPTGPGEVAAGAHEGTVATAGDARGERGNASPGAGIEGTGAAQGRGDGSGRGHRSAPTLIAHSAACNDLFPYAARTDRGRVVVDLGVAPNGRASTARVIAASPSREGFRQAAHHCVRRLRFLPALDAEGQAIASRTQVRLGFRRN